jgi:hypothetical protein
MIELLYGASDFARIADREIREGRAVSLRFHGWRRPFVYRLLARYAEYDRLSQRGTAPRSASLGLAWRILLAPTLFGLVHQARFGLDPLPRTSCRLILSRLLSDVSPFKVDR